MSDKYSVPSDVFRKTIILIHVRCEHGWLGRGQLGVGEVILVVLDFVLHKGRGLLVHSVACPCQKLSPVRQNGGPTRRAVVASAFLVVACVVLLQNPRVDCFPGSIRRNPGTPPEPLVGLSLDRSKKKGCKSSWSVGSCFPSPGAVPPGRPEAHSMSATTFSVVLTRPPATSSCLRTKDAPVGKGLEQEVATESLDMYD